MLKCYQSETNFLAISVVTTSGYRLLKGQTEPTTGTHNYLKINSKIIHQDLNWSYKTAEKGTHGRHVRWKWWEQLTQKDKLWS